MKRKLITGGGNSFVGAVKNSTNKDLKVLLSREKCLYVLVNHEILEGEDIDDLTTEEYKKYLFQNDGKPVMNGGTLIFSTEVNSTDISSSPIKNWIAKKFASLKNKLTMYKVLDKLRRKHSIYAWTIGRYLVGTYTGNNGKTFNENSISINIIGQELKTIFSLAKDVCAEFKQESVLVEDRATRQIYFVTQD